MISAIDLGKLVGLMEGEGSFGVNRRGKYGRPTPRLSFVSTDEDVAMWVASTIGRRIVYRQSPKAYGSIVGTKPQFAVVETGARAAGWMMTLYAHLHSRRRDKIREILAEWRRNATPAGSLTWIRYRLFGEIISASCGHGRQLVGGMCGMCWMRKKRLDRGGSGPNPGDPPSRRPRTRKVAA